VARRGSPASGGAPRVLTAEWEGFGLHYFTGLGEQINSAARADLQGA